MLVLDRIQGIDMVFSQDKPNAKYCEKYDAYYNSETGEWYEELCYDPECEYCKNRPENYYGIDT